MSTQNVSIPATDSRVVRGPPDEWVKSTHDPNNWLSWNEDATITVTVPGNATAIYWMARTPPTKAQYGLCIDCAEQDLVTNNTDVLKWVTLDPLIMPVTQDPQVVWSTTSFPPTTDPPAQHTLRIKNFKVPDNNATGELNVNSFSVGFAPVMRGDTQQSSSSASITTSSSLTSSSSLLFASQTPSASSVPATSATQQPVSTSLIIASSIAGFEFLILLGLLIAFLIRRRKPKVTFYAESGSNTGKGREEEGLISSVDGYEGRKSLDYDPSEELDHHHPLPRIVTSNVPNREGGPSPSPTVYNSLSAMFNNPIVRTSSNTSTVSPISPRDPRSSPSGDMQEATFSFSPLQSFFIKRTLKSQEATPSISIETASMRSAEGSLPHHDSAHPTVVSFQPTRSPSLKGHIGWRGATMP